MRIPNVLSIAGSDPSGGAGVQGDLKTFSALGAYGMAVVTALTAQNTTGVTGIHDVPADFVARQIDAVLADVRVDAVKIGMVASAANVDAIVDALARRVNPDAPRPAVVDPVMVAKGGHLLLDPEAVAVLRDRLVPAATILTPNIPEAAVLLGAPEASTIDEMRDAARALFALGPAIVYVKGGHLPGAPRRLVDVVFDGHAMIELESEWIDTARTHGTGCALSSAIAALLPRCADPLDAVRGAHAFVARAIAASSALGVGRGHGPVHHFHRLWSDAPSLPGLTLTRP